MTILTVGTGSQYEYHSISAAVAAAQSGDTVDVEAGTYTNDFVNTTKSLTLQAVGGVVKMVATVAPPDQKGIITEGASGASFTVNGFDISGAAISAGAGGNGAGIRYQGGSLTLNNDYIHNNQDGILADADPNGTVTINSSEFAYNGSGTGKTHNIYIGDVQQLTVNDSYFHDANVGHEIKSRAENTVITNSRIFDNNSTASYSIDLPNGGNAVITNDTIEQGPKSGNPIIISYGEEGALHSGQTVLIAGDTIVNDKSGSVYGVVNRAPTPVTLVGNQVYGLNSQNLTYGPATVAGTVYLQNRPTLDTGSHWAPVTTGTIGDPPAPTLLNTVATSASASDPSLPAASATDPKPAAAGSGTGGWHALLPGSKAPLAEMAGLSNAPGARSMIPATMQKAVGAMLHAADSLHAQGALAMLHGAHGATMG